MMEFKAKKLFIYLLLLLDAMSCSSVSGLPLTKEKSTVPDLGDDAGLRGNASRNEDSTYIRNPLRCLAYMRYCDKDDIVNTICKNDYKPVFPKDNGRKVDPNNCKEKINNNNSDTSNYSGLIVFFAAFTILLCFAFMIFCYFYIKCFYQKIEEEPVPNPAEIGMHGIYYVE